MDMKVVNSIKYGWHTIALMKIVHLRHLCQNLYQLQNRKNFADISGAQKPTWAKFLEFDFFISKDKAILYRYYQNKNPLWVN